ncbi:MAG: type II toxin-antitoxin system RelE/ParE family toxin [Proteobacteria bacterium]|jgi:phage-related protein|nr:type II toxin-antitoxin system RelE/ParE family toxin [Pseudomonadota bacterium]
MVDEPKLNVKFFKTPSGKEPVREWLADPKQVKPEDKKTIGIDIKTVQFGWPMGMPIVRKMEADLWEVRSHISAGIARVLFTVKETTMVLLHGFIKKGDKTPQEDLELARDRKNKTLRGE